MKKSILNIRDSDSDSDDEHEQMIKKAQKKKPVPRGSKLRTKEDVDLSRQHTEFIKHLVSERKKESMTNEIERMLKALEIVQEAIDDADSDEEELEEQDLSELYKNLMEEDEEYASDDEPRYLGYDYDVEEYDEPVRKPPPLKKKPKPTPKPVQRTPSKPIRMIPRQRKQESTPTPTPMKSKPKPKARAITYKGIEHKFEKPSIGLGFKGARHLKEQMKLKEFIKERMEEEATKKAQRKRGRPKKEKPQRTMRERKESAEAFEGKKSSYKSRIDRYITNQYKNGMIEESKDPKVHEKVVEYCLSKKPKKMSAKLLSEAFDHVVKGTKLRDKKGFGL